MSGYIGNDGSQLIGGLNPSGVVQAGIVDAQGRLIISPNAVGNPFITEDQIRAYTIAGTPTARRAASRPRRATRRWPSSSSRPPTTRRTS